MPPTGGERPGRAPGGPPTPPQNAYLQYDATGATFIIVPDRPGKEVDWDAVAEQVQTAVQGLETELTLNLDDLVEQAKVTAEDPELQGGPEGRPTAIWTWS